jgi:hypothetical protein
MKSAAALDIWYMKKTLLCLAILIAETVGAASTISGQNLLAEGEVSVAPGATGTVVVFLSARCPCSNSHIEVLSKAAAEFKEFNFVAVHSNLEETKEEAVKYFTALKLPFPVIQDRNLKLADEFRALKTPHAFVLSPSGTVLYKGGVTNSNHAPAADKNFLKDALADLRAGNAVRSPEGRTLGCEIKRRRTNAW